MTGLIRWSVAMVVAAVAGFAAVVSYSHIYDLGRVHGQAGAAGVLLPLSVDGLILASSLVLLHEAKSGRPAPSLAYVMLALGVAATLAANAAYGAAWGATGIVVSAWPAVAFIGSAEMGLVLVRRSGTRAAAEAAENTAIAAARAAFAESHASGAPLSARALDRQYKVGRYAAGKIVAAASNGSAS